MAAKKKGKTITEKKTKEKYSSKMSMMKHEKGESKMTKKKEGELPKGKKGGKKC